MLKIAVVLLENSYCSSISGFVDVFQIANEHIRRQPDGLLQPFTWSLVSDRAGQQVCVQGGIRIASDTSYRSLGDFDLVYLPGVHYPGTTAFETWLSERSDVCVRLKALEETGVWLAANCTSTFLLGEAGLLDHKTATTTWWLEQKFRNRYPLARLETHRTVTEDSGIYCAGTMTAYNQLAIRLVGHYASPDIATMTAKSLLLDQTAKSQSPYFDLVETSESDDALVSQAQYWLKNHLSQEVDFVQFADSLGVSQRTLIRRFKQATGTAPLSYLQGLRIEYAKDLISKSPLSVSEIMLQVGYSDPSAFIRLFKQRVGLTPSAYRLKFSTYHGG